MNKFYVEILKPVIENEIIPTIGDLVETEVEQYQIKAKISMNELLDMLDRIHEKVLM